MQTPLTSCRFVSERNPRPAALHHLLLLLQPGGVRADPLLLQWEPAAVLQHRHGSRESQDTPTWLSFGFTESERNSTNTIKTQKSPIKGSWYNQLLQHYTPTTMLQRCLVFWIQSPRRWSCWFLSSDPIPLPVSPQNPCPETTAGFLSSMTFWWFTRWVSPGDEGGPSRDVSPETQRERKDVEGCVETAIRTEDVFTDNRWRRKFKL